VSSRDGEAVDAAGTACLARTGCADKYPGIDGQNGRDRNAEDAGCPGSRTPVLLAEDRRGTRPAASDLTALDPGLREQGRRVPDDVAVAGFDDSVAADVGLPAADNGPAAGRGVAKALMLPDRMGDPDAPITSRVFPPTLTPCAST
jgi:Periplasmic binding protein-like domain